MNNNILVCFAAYRVLSKIGWLWGEEQVIKIVIVLHRSDGEKGTEDTGDLRERVRLQQRLMLTLKLP